MLIYLNPSGNFYNIDKDSTQNLPNIIKINGFNFQYEEQHNRWLHVVSTQAF